MDGYSVKDAASVLGIPKRRVWELIARGVLSGAPEGDGGMRVFLQPHPARPSPLSAGHEEQPRTNGNGGAHPEPSGEGSPFREILTEFRSLTERYGQALLALGEARGEVAALRSRVELLEARLDLRLPGPRQSASVAWSMPEYTPPAPVEASIPEVEIPEVEIPLDVEPPEVDTPPEVDAPPEDAPPAAEARQAVDAPPEPEPPPEVESSPEVDVVLQAASVETAPDPESPEPIEPAAEAAPSMPPRTRPDKGASRRRRRALRSHSAIAGIAEALARAQDPTLADLPGAREAAEALAALQREVEARSATVEDDAATEPEAAAEAATETEPTAAKEAATETEPTAAKEAATETEPEAVMEAVAEAEPEDSFVEPAVAVHAQELVEDESLRDDRPEAAVTEAVPELAVEPTEAAESAVTEAVPELAVEPTEAAESAADSHREQTAAAGPELTVETDEPAAEMEAGTETEPEASTRPVEDASSLYTTEVVEPDWFADGDFTWLEAAQAESVTIEAAADVDAETAEAAPGRAGEEQQAPEAAEAEPEAVEAEPEAAQVAPEEHEPPTAEVEAEAEDAEPQTAEVEAEAEDAEPQTAKVEPESGEATSEEHEEVDAEAAPAAEAIQDAFEPAQSDAMPEQEQVAVATLEPEADLPDAPAEPTHGAFEGVDVVARQRPEPVDGLAEEAIQDAFEPPPSDVPAATATPREAAFAPLDVAVFAVDQSEPSASAPAREERPRRLTFRAAVPPTVPPPAAAPIAPPAEEELMWLGDEFEAAGLEIATVGWRSEPDASVEPPREPSAPTMSDSELEQMAQNEGWETDEVDAIRTLLGRSTPAPAAPAGLPDDVHPMDEASEDVDEDQSPAAVTQPAEQAVPNDDWPVREIEPQTLERPIAEPPVAAASATERPRSSTQEPEGEEGEDQVRPSGQTRAMERRPTTTEPDWLRRRRGPAATAYRRLRRLLPG